MSAPDSELSWRTLGVGAVLGVVFAGTGMYAGTKIGFVDGGNIAAALVAFALLSLLSRTRPRATEGNIAQTVSSSAAMMAISGGMVGPIAALSLSGHEHSPTGVVLWGIAVGAFGCLLAVPLRGAFVERGSLPFPSGIATAEVLDTVYTRGRTAAAHLRLLGVTVALAGAVTFARTYAGWLPEVWALPLAIGSLPAASVGVGVSASPLLVGIGALAGIRTGAALVLGSAVAWVAIAPNVVSAGIAEPDYVSLLGWLLWPGTGLMVGGSVGSVIGAWRGVRANVRELHAAGTGAFRTRRGHVIAIAVTAIAIVVLGQVVFGVHAAIGVLGIALSFVLCTAAARAMGETDNTPAGPLGGFAQVVVGAVAPGGVAAPLTGGGIVNGSLMHSAMLLQNWRAGRILGASPQRQLVAQLVGVLVGAIACAAAFELIRRGYGLGTEAMPAPAAQSWKATAEIVQHGTSALPAYAPLAALVAFVVGAALAFAQPRASFVPSPVAMGLACILTPYMSITIALGAFAWWLLARWRDAWTNEYGLAVASGLIAGEALAGLAIAALMVAGL